MKSYELTIDERKALQKLAREQLKCKLLKVHPFSDGNGRTIRCFINKLMEDAGLPSVYIKVDEREEYLKYMDKALCTEDYSDIKKFYRSINNHKE